MDLICFSHPMTLASSRLQDFWLLGKKVFRGINGKKEKCLSKRRTMTALLKKRVTILLCPLTFSAECGYIWWHSYGSWWWPQFSLSPCLFLLCAFSPFWLLILILMILNVKCICFPRIKAGQILYILP